MKNLDILIKNVAELFKVKTIVTFIVLITISVLVSRGTDVDPTYYALASTIITYFFTRKNE